MTLYHIPVCEERFNGWMCRIIAREKSWEHTRRKRRLALRQATSERLNNGDTKCIEENMNNISSTVLVTEEFNGVGQTNKNSDATSINMVKENNAGSEENSEEKVCEEKGRTSILTCKLCIETKNSEYEMDDVFKIWMIYENGSGGLNALHSLRQYFINRLGVREKILNSCPKDNKKKRKKARRDVAGTSFVPIVQSQSDNEDLSKKKNIDSSDDS